MVNNFELIKPLLKWDSDDEFYFVQVIQRKKDNPGIVKGSNNNNRLIKAYYIKSTEHLDKYKEEMITLADTFNARVGINLNKRSFKRTTLNTLEKIIHQMQNGDYHNTMKAYNSACGIYNSQSDRIWLLDVDVRGICGELIGFIETCQPIHVTKVIEIIPTKSGYHIITKPFDTRGFVKIYPEIEIHKNNPTVLYIPEK